MYRDLLIVASLLKQYLYIKEQLHGFFVHALNVIRIYISGLSKRI